MAGGISSSSLLKKIGFIRLLEDWMATIENWENKQVLCFSGTARLLFKICSLRIQSHIYRLNTELQDEVGRTKNTLAVTGPQSDYSTPAELMETVAEIWQRSSRIMNELCRAEKILYFHFLQPNQYIGGTKTFTRQETNVFPKKQPYRSGVEIGYPYLEAAAAAFSHKGVRYFDLTRIFQNVSDTIYRDGCCHVNDQGNRILAEAIGKIVLES